MTIYDIAKELGVSPTTVSQALNGNTRVAAKTRARVTEFAMHNGFRRSEQARNFRLKRTFNIAIVVYNIDNDFWCGFVKAVEDALGEEYNVLLCNTEGNPEKEKKIFFNLMQRNVDGVIVQPASDEKKHFMDMVRNSIPVVLLEETEEPELSFVKGNDHLAAYRSTKVCIEQGYRKIAFLSIPPDCVGGRGWIRGFKQAVAEEDCIGEVLYVKETTCEEVKKVFLPRVGEFPLVFCDTHLICMLLRVLFTHHVRIPEDLSLIAWSNKYFLSYMTPSISIISIPVEEIGRRAAGIILRNLNGEPHVEKTFIDETLILRESFQPSAGSPPAGVSGQYSTG